MDVAKLVQDCIKNFNLDSKVLRDIAFAVCIADKLNGTNNRELDVDKFVSSSDELDWNNILSVLSITPVQSNNILPRVQKLRVISDMLSISVGSKVQGLQLMSISSKKVASKLGVHLTSVDYADEDICYENLSKINDVVSSASLDLSNLEGVYKNLVVYTNKIIDLGLFDIPNGVNSILIPESIFNGVGKRCSTSELIDFLTKKEMSIASYTKYIIDIYCFNVVPEVAKLLSVWLVKNEVMFNLILTRLNNYASSYLPVGTYSLEGYTNRLSVLRNAPSYLSRKINIVFSESSSFSETTILGCISVLLFLKKTNIKREEFIKEMEVLTNECRQ